MDTEFPRRPTIFLSLGGRSDCPPWDLRYRDYMHIWVKDCGCKIVIYEVHQHQSSFKKWESLRPQFPVCLYVQSRSVALHMKLSILCYFFQNLTFMINSTKLKHWKHLTNFVTEKTGAVHSRETAESAISQTSNTAIVFCLIYCLIFSFLKVLLCLTFILSVSW